MGRGHFWGSGEIRYFDLFSESESTLDTGVDVGGYSGVCAGSEWSGNVRGVGWCEEGYDFEVVFLGREGSFVALE